MRERARVGIAIFLLFMMSLILIFVSGKFIFTGKATVTGYGDPVCGNGAVETGEACDDSNTVTETCGDGTTHSGTYCNAGCSAILTLTEECDDGNTVSGDGCSSICEVDGGVDIECGNGVVETSETCDDGNTVSGDGCSATCRTESTSGVCGDGTTGTGEQCDDGNTVSGDGCSATCQTETVAQCSDNADNDGDTLIDDEDPGCWRDPNDPNTYNVADINEVDTVDHDVNYNGEVSPQLQNQISQTIQKGGEKQEGSLRSLKGWSLYLLIFGILVLSGMMIMIVYFVVRLNSDSDNVKSVVRNKDGPVSPLTGVNKNVDYNPFNGPV